VDERAPQAEHEPEYELDGGERRQCDSREPLIKEFQRDGAPGRPQPPDRFPATRQSLTWEAEDLIAAGQPESTEPQPGSERAARETTARQWSPPGRRWGLVPRAGYRGRQLQDSEASDSLIESLKELVALAPWHQLGIKQRGNVFSSRPRAKLSPEPCRTDIYKHS
jgi:hypothetical protein